MALKKQTVTTLQKMKTDGDKIAMLTCYDFTTARLIEQSAIDAVLVGDSLGMTMMGYEDTLPVTMEDMIHDQQAVENAGRLIKEGHANAVKLEGGAKYCSRIRAIVDAQIPVVAHIGLTPQSVNAFGGFKVQGRNVSRARELIDDAKKIEQAGAFMLTLECVPEKLASLITEEIAIPTIGIGAGAGCDGQILVYQDMLDMYDGLAPKFVKHFAHIGREMKDAFNEYSDQVKKRSFPVTGEHTFKISDEVMEELKK